MRGGLARRGCSNALLWQQHDELATGKTTWNWPPHVMHATAAPPIELAQTPSLLHTPGSKKCKPNANKYLLHAGLQTYKSTDVFNDILYARLDFETPPWDTLSSKPFLTVGVATQHSLNNEMPG
jgi:hypothetical protein